MTTTPDPIKKALTKALEEFDALDNHELVITPEYMDEIEPGTTYKGMFVVLGKEVTVRARKAAPVAPTIDPKTAGKLVFWFYDQKNKPFPVDNRKAWRYLTQNGEWKFTPRYIGATSEKDFKKALSTLPEDKRLTELTFISNEQSEKMAPLLQKEYRQLMEEQRQKLEALTAEFVKTADPKVRPTGSDLVSVIAKTDGTVRGNPDQIARGGLTI